MEGVYERDESMDGEGQAREGGFGEVYDHSQKADQAEMTGAVDVMLMRMVYKWRRAQRTIDGELSSGKGRGGEEVSLSSSSTLSLPDPLPSRCNNHKRTHIATRIQTTAGQGYDWVPFVD